MYCRKQVTQYTGDAFGGLTVTTLVPVRKIRKHEGIIMAEEVQATQPAEAAAPQEGAQAAGKAKTKKVNRMDAKELAKKIEEIENTKMTSSKYYKLLLQRKKELGI
jgi:hypothetical protein